ncbi:MAG: hypothetical protein ACD_20C00227G0001 [uncultured bacterium]|nr:MAG: hypothetical protein ACD_20C00227G0001 [uncultured bacterium]
MAGKFEELLKELSVQLDSEFSIDQNKGCLIAFDENIKVQLELDENQEYLIVFSIISAVPPGKFRENVLLSALKENDKFPYVAAFGYLEKENSLAMFNFLYLDSLNIDILTSYLAAFVDLAALYQNDLLHGQTSPILKPV